MPTIITPERARKIYVNAMQNLYGAIQTHKCPTGETDAKGKPKHRTGISAFCEMTSLSRQNIQEVLGCKTERTMSLGTFLRCIEALGLVDGVTPEQAKENVARYSGPAFGYSLQMFYEIDSNLVKDATMCLECL